MDPISLIVAAVVAGATSGVKETATEAIQDAYAALKRLIRRRLAEDPTMEPELDRLEADPESTPDALSQALKAAGADRDNELITAAQQLMREADPAGARAGRYNVQITGGKGIVVGDHANVTMNFDEE